MKQANIVNMKGKQRIKEEHMRAGWLATRTQSTPPDPSVLYSKLGQYPDEAWGWDSVFSRDPRRAEGPIQLYSAAGQP